MAQAIARLRTNQVKSIVNPMPVKKKNGRIKMHEGRVVYLGSNGIRQGKQGKNIVTPHPYAFEFIVIDSSEEGLV